METQRQAVEGQGQRVETQRVFMLAVATTEMGLKSPRENASDSATRRAL